MTHLSLKKVTVGFLTAIFLLGSVSVFIDPKITHAQAGCLLGGAAAGAAAGGGAAAATVAPTGFPVKDISLNAIAAANLTANTVTAANSTVESTVTCILNGLAWTLAKLTIQSLTRSTVNWINSGFRGSPAFISDLNENLKYLGDAVAEDFFLNLNRTVVNATGFNIVSPFQDQLSQKLRAEYYRASSGLLGLNQYDLSGRSTDPKAFLNGDFSKGGFNAYFSANGNPANNPFDAYRLANRQLYAQIDAEAQKRKEELGWGKGFLPWRGNCTPTATASAPGSGDVSVSSADTRAVIDAAARTEAGGGGAVATQSVPLSKAEQCRNNPVRTPGAVIEAQLENSLGSGIRQLELADSINEIVGALLGQLVNQVLGAAGLSGVSQPSSGGGRSYLDQATSADQFNGVASSISNGVIQDVRGNRARYQQMRDDWQKVFDAAEDAEQSCGIGEEILTVLSRASAGIVKAEIAVREIQDIEAEVEAAISSTAVDKTTLISAAATSYQSFLAAPTTPSPREISEASIESADTSRDEDAEQSLYSRMVELQRSCNSRGN